MRIVDGTGTNVAKYRYDPYGNLVSSSGTMAAANPLRYRGYYFDSETGFYYLQSRYYDPKICRFINADDFASTGQGILGHNMFAYCNNNPIHSTDPLGTFSIGAFAGAVVGGAVAGTLISTVSYAVISGLNGNAITKDGLIDAAISGAVSGAIGGAIGTISVGAKAVTMVQKVIPSVSEKMLTEGAKAIASLTTGILMSNNQTEQGIMLASVSTSTFLGSMIDATTNTFGGSAFCNYASTLFVGTAIEVGTVLARQVSRN